MATATSTVFDSIESAQEYVGLLCDALDEAAGSIEQELALGGVPGRPRHEDALRLVDYKLKTLRHHFVASRLLLNDLRTLRRYLFEERTADADRNLFTPERSRSIHTGPRPVQGVLVTSSAAGDGQEEYGVAYVPSMVPLPRRPDRKTLRGTPC